MTEESIFDRDVLALLRVTTDLLVEAQEALCEEPIPVPRNVRSTNENDNTEGHELFFLFV